MTRKHKAKTPWDALVGVAFLSLSLLVGVLMVQSQTSVTKKAASSACPAAEQCPNSKQPSLLQSCHPGDGDGTTQDSLCNAKGRIETCGAGNRKYCCPAPGAAWTTNLTACATPPPTAPPPTATPTPTPTTNTCANPYLNSNPWDVDRNTVVNIIDIGIIIDNYAKSSCSKPAADVDGNGTINIVDIGIVIDHYSF